MFFLKIVYITLLFFGGETSYNIINNKRKYCGESVCSKESNVHEAMLPNKLSYIDMDTYNIIACQSVHQKNRLGNHHTFSESNSLGLEFDLNTNSILGKEHPLNDTEFSLNNPSSKIANQPVDTSNILSKKEDMRSTPPVCHDENLTKKYPCGMNKIKAHEHEHLTSDINLSMYKTLENERDNPFNQDKSTDIEVNDRWNIPLPVMNGFVEKHTDPHMSFSHCPTSVYPSINTNYSTASECLIGITPIKNVTSMVCGQKYRSQQESINSDKMSMHLNINIRPEYNIYSSVGTNSMSCPKSLSYTVVEKKKDIADEHSHHSDRMMDFYFMKILSFHTSKNFLLNYGKYSACSGALIDTESRFILILAREKFNIGSYTCFIFVVTIKQFYGDHLPQYYAFDGFTSDKIKKIGNQCYNVEFTLSLTRRYKKIDGYNFRQIQIFISDDSDHIQFFMKNFVAYNNSFSEQFILFKYDKNSNEKLYFTIHLSSDPVVRMIMRHNKRILLPINKLKQGKILE